MRLLVALFVLAAAGYVVARPNDSVSHSRGCIYINGRCYKECEEGTHAYAVGCDYVVPEATCANPSPVADTRGKICDYSACYCDEGTVRDSVTKKCVPLDQCPKADNA